MPDQAGHILVTGGAGFIGSHVVELLMSGGERPVVIDDFSTGSRANVPDGVDIHHVDIADAAAMRIVAARLPPLSAIIHCAAQASVIASTEDPARDLFVNVGGTLNVLSIATTEHCPVVFTSTGGAIYGALADRPTPETAPAAPDAPYGASKACAEVYIRLHGRTNGLHHAILRLGNVYGPRQRGDGEAGVVAIIATRLLSGQRVTLYGHGAPTRDYVHVKDVARALLMARGTTGTYNIANGSETSVDRVFQIISDALGVDGDSLKDHEDLRPGEVEASCLDVRRALAELGWSPSITATDGIASTAAWFRALQTTIE